MTITDTPTADIMTLAEAARILRVSAPTAYRMAQAGEFPAAFKVGHLWRVSRSALEAWITEQAS